MRLPRINTIKWKLTLVILGTSAVVLVLGGIAVLIYDSMAWKNNFVSQIESMAEIIVANSAAAVAFRNETDAADILESLPARQEIDGAWIHLKDGQVLASYRRRPEQPASSTPPFTGHRFENGRLVVGRAVDFGGDKVGWVIVWANLEQQAARSKSFLLIAVSSLGGLIGVALLLAARLQRLVSNPIHELAEVATQITRHNDYSVRAKTSSTDEFGALVAAFNQMLAEIERQNHALEYRQGQLRLALSASKMGVWEWNIQTDRVDWSIENNPVLGIPSSGLDLQSFERLIHPEDASSFASAIAQSVQTLAPLWIEYRVGGREGPPVWVAHHGQVHLDRSGKPFRLSGIVQNITLRKLAEAEHMELVSKLLTVEEDERRRIARELHDTTVQHLASLKMIFTSQLRGPTPMKPPVPAPWTEGIQLLDQAMQEIRTLTYALHPPVLEEFGLADAIKDFALGMTRRSNVKVNLSPDCYTGRLPRNMELTLFRVVQESVSNAVRHSGTSEVNIRVDLNEQLVSVEIQDFGCGLPGRFSPHDIRSLRHSGVGLAGMQERMNMIGGTLSVESDAEGVTVLACVPVPIEGRKL